MEVLQKWRYLRLRLSAIVDIPGQWRCCNSGGPVLVKVLRQWRTISNGGPGPMQSCKTLLAILQLWISFNSGGHATLEVPEIGNWSDIGGPATV